MKGLNVWLLNSESRAFGALLLWGQRDIDRMQSWAEKWQMEFNLEKWEAIHFGRTNLNAEYRVNGRTLGSVEEQRDLGVLKVATQVDRAVKKAYGVLAFISRGGRV